MEDKKEYIMISKTQIETAKNLLVNELSPLSIYIFGSYAWGKPTEYSDLDLFLVINNTKEPIHKRCSRAYKCLSTPETSFPLDIIVLTENEFKKSISNHQTLYYKISKDGAKIYG